MDNKAALKARLENLSPAQRTALLQQVSRAREQQQARPPAALHYPLSLAQRRLWMLAQLGSEANAAYNITAAYYFADGLDPERLLRAWRRLLATHEVLRSAFTHAGSELLQTPRSAMDWNLQRRTLTAAANLEAQLLQLAGMEAAVPFDLQQDWLLRVIHCDTEAGHATGLIIVIHHIVCDGLSITGMIQQLAQFYGETEQHDAAALVVPVSGVATQQYRDYVDYEARADTGKARAYWKTIFASAPETLDALLDLPRPVVKDFRGGAATLTLPATDCAAFEALCHAHSATLYMGLVALVQVLLARVANVGEVTLGTPVAGRPGAQFDSVVGPFVNTIALRQSIDRTQTFAELLTQARRRVLGGFEHQGLAFDALVTELGFAKDPSRSPLYDVMLGLNSAAELALRFGTSAGRALRIPLTSSKVDLTFHFEKDSDGSLRLELEYASGIVLETSAARLCHSWRLLLLGIVREPARALGDFELQTDAERRALLEQVNATSRPYPQHSSLISEFRKTVQAWPAALAVHAGTVQLSYRELDDLSDKVACSLLSHPAHQRGCHIALLLEKDERALIVILAILKSGAVYVPLAANTPLERVGEVLAAGGVRLLFAEASRRAELQQLDVDLLDCEALLLPDPNAGTRAPLSVEDARSAAREPAYLMFTSGSTGKPKGTLIEQRSILRLVCNTDYHQVQPHERVLLTGSLAFDAATFEIWGPLLNGGCVCIPPGTTLLDVHDFQALVDHYQVDTAFLTTGLFNQLVDNSAAAFGRLRTVLTGGEKVSVEHVGRLLQAQPALTLLHVYGPTENTTFSTWHRIRAADLALATIPIGRPIANSRIYLLDQNLQPVPIGVPGEIYCGGDGIARGYLEQPETGRSTQPVFLPDPFVPEGRGRLYRTGDLAKWNDQRELIFLGRNDRQVKIRGFRVELAEVEHHLRSVPGITDAFVQARGAAGSSELIAWLVVPAASVFTVASVRDALKGSLPNYMLPGKVVCIERLPLNASGKVDSAALPLPEQVDAAVATVGELQGKAEQELARLYAEVLGLTGNAALAIDRSANFFSLGGDSIRAIQLVSLARAAGYHFTLKDIFAADTLAGLAATAAVAPVAAPQVVLSSGPLSPVQRWWLDSCGAPANHFNLSSVFSVAGSLDVAVLRTTLDELLVLHPALRLSLDPATQQQRIRDSGRYLLCVVDAGQTRQDCWRELQQAIDLDAGVLLAVGVAEEADTTYLAIVIHHVAADEVSGRLFGENLKRLYHRNLEPQHGNAISAGQEPLRETLGLVNWAAQLSAVVEQGGMDSALGYWQGVVARGRAMLDQQQKLFAVAQDIRGEALDMLSNSDTQQLLQLSSTLLRMTAQEVLLAAFIAAWRRTLGSAECLLMLEGHGREQLAGLGDCSSTLGWFTSLYPFAFSAAEGGELDLYRSVKDSFRQVPDKGFTYLPLRYYKDQPTQDALALRPQISFNYLGETQQHAQQWLQPTDEPAGVDHGAAVNEPFELDVLARISEGCFELTLRGRQPQPTVALAVLAAAWKDELVALATRLQAVSANECLLSLSDSVVPFATLAELDGTLAALQLAGSEIAEILPLTGVQAGMWLHCATHPTAYQDQVVLRLQQPLDETRFATAVAALVAETQALRTGFAQTERGELLQIVFRERAGTYQQVDASAWGADRDSRLAELRAALRGNQRDLLRHPLFRLTLVHIDAACFDLIIDFHHMALDGWTSALLLQRLEALYFGDARGGDQGAATGMRGYFEWLGRQPVDAARTYWQGLLGDYSGRSAVPTHLPRIPAAEPRPLFVEARIGAALNTTLLAWCAQHGLTVNAAVQALWGVFLGRLTGGDDLVFGATVSGRDVDLAGVESIAGMLINTLPVRIQPAQGLTFAELARTTARQFAESRSHGQLALAEILTLTPARAGLLTHALVFENYPTSAAAAARWHWQPQEIFDPMHFEFGLIVAPLADDLSFRFVADGSLYLQPRLEQLGAEMCALLAALLNAEQPLSALAPAPAAGWSISANFTADQLVGLLHYHEYISGSSGAVTLLPYDQSVQELLNPASRLRRLQAPQHVVLWRPVTDAAGQVMASAATEQLTELATALASYARTCTGARLYFVPCPWLDCDWTLYREFAAYVKGALGGLRNAEVVSLENLADSYALEQPCHPPALIFGDIPYSDAFFAALANRLTRLSDLQRRPPVKVYVVDADDTLWGGIVGEEGPQGVRLDAVHLQLQQQLMNARAAGALICVATKNNEADVRAVFEQREMPLRWEQLTRVCANWQPKSDSILALADELSLGLDSFVFLDDSPLECAQVLAACPGVRAIQLPPAPTRAAFLAHLWLLDARVATREDAARAQMYADELQRSSARKATGSYADFLAALDIRIDVRRLEPQNVARSAQLSQRTNQFNTTGLRYTEADIDALLQRPGIDIRCVSVTDKYGDYGLVGSIFIERGAQAWTVFGFMLSCRVLGRGVEHACLRQLAAEAAACGSTELSVNFVKLARNAPAHEFLQSLAVASAHNDTAMLAFSLPVTAANTWQPGSADAGDAEEESASASAAPEPTVVAEAERGAFQSARTSAYYSYLAATLTSGTAILQQLQQLGSVQKTGGIRSTLQTPPATPTEVALATWFTELLGQPQVFREDTFHDLGGHSLKAMLLFSRIAAHYGVALDFRDLQAYPSLAELAARIDAAVADTGSDLTTVPKLLRLPEADSYPASPGQARLWMLEQLRAAGPSPFHMHATLTIGGSIDRHALDLALQILYGRHEALRTCFRADADGSIRQVIMPLAALDTRVQWFDAALTDTDLSALAQQQSEQAFDLGNAPLLRIAAGELAAGGSALFLTLHHSISDGWSIGIFSRELTALYSECSAGRQALAAQQLPPAPALQFRDFASWQLQWLDSAAGEQALQFWREHFADQVEALQLPAVAPRPAVKQSAGAAINTAMRAEVWSGFTRHLAGLGISAFAGLFAAVQLVLARLSAQQNFCVGTAVAGRQHVELESVIGFFVNVVPLRTTLEQQSTVAEFLRAAADEVTNCLSHQSVPFDTIVAALNLPRDRSRTPLFDVLLVLQNTDMEDLKFGAHVAAVHPLPATTSQYDLTLSAFPAADGSLTLRAEYASDLYAAAHIELLLRCIEQTLHSLSVADTDALESIAWVQPPDVAVVEAFENASIEAASFNSSSSSAGPALLPQLFSEAAETANGRISDEQTDWSYIDLKLEMQRIASLLRATAPLPDNGAPPPQQLHAGVIGERSARSIAALLGVMEAGAVYVPLDLANPPDRLAMIIAEGAVTVLLSTDEQGAELAAALQQRHAGLRHVRYDDSAADPGPRATVLASASAYMIFTSGSTGKPKGVQVSHAAFSAMIRQQIPAFDVQASDVCAQFAALTFDASLSEIFLALTTGASLAITPDAARRDIDFFMAWLSASRTTVITLPPAFLRALGKRKLANVRVLITAGEAAIADDLRHYASSLRVINAYGPTETAVCATTYHVNPADAWNFGVPIGKALPGVLLTVRDAAGAPVPVGVSGELYIGGPTLAEGYFAAPELSAQKFTTLPAAAGRWYRSGDLVRWRADGLLEFVGRSDTQIKLRGFRIEPGEIEQAARAITGVDDAIALVHPDLGLVLYCVVRAIDTAGLKAAILAELGTTLPRHMLPGAVVLLEAFPLTTAGKVARTALLALASGSEVAFEAPHTPMEQALAQAWRRVMNVEQVGRNDDFFALGGDSIKALEVLSTLRALGFTCALQDFFAAPSLSGLAASLTPWLDSGRFSQPLSGPLTLLPVQNWFLRSRDQAAAGHFHIVTELKMAATVPESLLKRALAVLMRNHDSLRARFYRQDGHWVQHIQEVMSIDAAFCQYHCAASLRSAADSAAIEALACSPFALDTGPLFRCVLVCGPDGNGTALVLALHHLIADWVSLRILIADLNTVTQALLQGSDGSLEAPPHLLGLVAAERAAELAAQAPSTNALPDEYQQAVATLNTLALHCGVHSELDTLHLQLGADELQALRADLRQQSATGHAEFRLQDALLAVALGELAGLLQVGAAPLQDIPILIEGHGRAGNLDLARQVAWLTRARLVNVNPQSFAGSAGLLQANRILQADPAQQPDVFACMAAEPEMRGSLPALASVNYLGEFTGSQQQDGPFSLTNAVFAAALASASPVDVPLHIEFYVVDKVLEIQVAWAPTVFASAAMRACWQRIRDGLACR